MTQQTAIAEQEQLVAVAGVLMEAVGRLRALGLSDLQIVELLHVTAEARERLDAPERQH